MDGKKSKRFQQGTDSTHLFCRFATRANQSRNIRQLKNDESSHSLREMSKGKKEMKKKTEGIKRTFFVPLVVPISR